MLEFAQTALNTEGLQLTGMVRRKRPFPIPKLAATLPFPEWTGVASRRAATFLSAA